jgi:hypothetical protein
LLQRFGCIDSQQRTVPGTFSGACEQQQQQQQQQQRRAKGSVVLTIERIAGALSGIDKKATSLNKTSFISHELFCKFHQSLFCKMSVT